MFLLALPSRILNVNPNNPEKRIYNKKGLHYRFPISLYIFNRYICIFWKNSILVIKLEDADD